MEIYNFDLTCDMCHAKGAYDFGRDHICDDCLVIYKEMIEKNDTHYIL